MVLGEKHGTNYLPYTYIRVYHTCSVWIRQAKIGVISARNDTDFDILGFF